MNTKDIAKKYNNLVQSIKIIEYDLYKLTKQETLFYWEKHESLSVVALVSLLKTNKAELDGFSQLEWYPCKKYDEYREQIIQSRNIIKSWINESKNIKMNLSDSSSLSQMESLTEKIDLLNKILEDLNG